MLCNIISTLLTSEVFNVFLKGTVPRFFLFHNNFAFGEYIHVQSVDLKVWFFEMFTNQKVNAENLTLESKISSFYG